jgi:serine/threonine-protein kinase HSL1, negative regulator of Swe1 kinase
MHLHVPHENWLPSPIFLHLPALPFPVFKYFHHEHSFIFIRFRTVPRPGTLFEHRSTQILILLPLYRLEGGELFDYIASRGRLPEDDARPIMKAIIDSVAYLHGLGIAHRDLKPENILFSTKEHKAAVVKLIDFGFAKQEKDDSAVLQTPIGTTAYVGMWELIFIH